MNTVVRRHSEVVENRLNVVNGGCTKEKKVGTTENQVGVASSALIGNFIFGLTQRGDEFKT